MGSLAIVFRSTSKEQISHLIGDQWKSDELIWLEFTFLRNFVAMMQVVLSLPIPSVFESPIYWRRVSVSIYMIFKIGQMKKTD